MQCAGLWTGFMCLTTETSGCPFSREWNVLDCGLDSCVSRQRPMAAPSQESEMFWTVDWTHVSHVRDQWLPLLKRVKCSGLWTWLMWLTTETSGCPFSREWNVLDCGLDSCDPRQRPVAAASKESEMCWTVDWIHVTHDRDQWLPRLKRVKCAGLWTGFMWPTTETSGCRA
jgi:hypothetical protein